MSHGKQKDNMTLVKQLPIAATQKFSINLLDLSPSILISFERVHCLNQITAYHLQPIVPSHFFLFKKRYHRSNQQKDSKKKTGNYPFLFLSSTSWRTLPGFTLITLCVYAYPRQHSCCTSKSLRNEFDCLPSLFNPI